MSRIRQVFRSLDGGAALVAYVMGGDPDVDTSEKVIESVIGGGADIVEIGIPFSDPIADGKSIQEAAVRSLASGTTPSQVLGLVRRIRQRHDTPVAIMTYYNILYSPGLARFLSEARAAGVDGLIIPDLPFDETDEYTRLAKRHSLDTILLAAPTSSSERISSLVSRSTGFLYLVSLLGVTGARSSVSDETTGLVRRIKSQTSGKIPLGVGFGISKPEHVRAVVDAGADAVIVGSGIVNLVGSDRPQREMLSEVETYVRSLKSATKGRKTRRGAVGQQTS